MSQILKLPTTFYVNGIVASLHEQSYFHFCTLEASAVLHFADQWINELLSCFFYPIYLSIIHFIQTFSCSFLSNVIVSTLYSICNFYTFIIHFWSMYLHLFNFFNDIILAIIVHSRRRFNYLRIGFSFDHSLNTNGCVTYDIA